MKLTKFIIWSLIAFSLLIFTACGGGGGGGSIGSGEVSMSITDAKPLLPEGADQATNLKITFTEVLVHKSGGGWISLPLTGDLPSNTIDLLQFYDGVTTEIVPPVLLTYGKYTQIRIKVSEAWISFDNSNNWDPVVIPPEHLKTDKNFTFDPQDPAAADIIIDFDLSQSLVVTDPFGTPSYKLKPVLHIVEAAEAASITGTISDQSFINYGTDEATITVMANGDVYTKITVERNPVPAEFTIFWLVPDQDYTVEIDMNPDDEDGAEWSQTVSGDDLEPGEEKDLRQRGAL